MKVEDNKSRNFLSDDGRIGIMIEIVNEDVSHITLARKGSSGLVELTEAQLQELAELVPAAAQFMRDLKATEPRLG